MVQDRDDRKTEKLPLRNVDIAVKAVDPYNTSIQLTANFTLDELQGFLEDLNLAAETAISRVQIDDDTERSDA